MFCAWFWATERRRIYGVFKANGFVFANEPLVSVSAPIIEAQIIETMLLNILNFESFTLSILLPRA
jgi:nicotinic acid phosphoribosyltransferase